jgi:dGTPase
MLRTRDVRERLEEQEERLAPRAARSRTTRGRLRDEEASPLRTEYQRDRDRIIHCKSFRRLKYKTQVFIAPLHDHYITRMTHTLQVSQIGRTIARALDLNEDLVEAMTLGHDLGHTPFGHAGEETLADLLPGGFRHNYQSLRLVDLLEKDGQGLNLTEETREGILKHSKVREDIAAEAWGTSMTLEGQICKLVDSIAYINHDIGDAIRAGMITEGDLPRECAEVLGTRHSQRIDRLVADVVEQSWEVAHDPRPLPDPPVASQTISLSPRVLEATNTLREYLFRHVYLAPAIRKETDKGQQVIRMLFAHFMKHPDQIPDELFRPEDELERSVADYIAGMTDRYAIQLFDELFTPRLWISATPGIPS